jgi:type IV pilus assembly protein PilP
MKADILTATKCTFFCVLFSLAIGILPATAQEKTLTNGFDYPLDNRPDPFYPFISKEKAIKELNEELVDINGEKLTGMRLFEPGQLTLVAIMNTANGKVAMAEDVTGKGYMLRENMLIGKRGQIIRIEDGQVIVKETLVRKSGNTTYNEIIMHLNKDEGKKR